MHFNLETAGRFAVIAAAALSLAAFNAPADAAKAGAATAGTESASDGGTQANASKRYCIVDEITGSRLPHKTCKTKAEWARDGVDIDHPSR